MKLGIDSHRVFEASPRDPRSGAPLRVALYSHDTKGLGHFRRNLRIAEALASDDITVLMIAGVREAGSFPMPDGVDCVTLPAYSKDDDGRYGSRHLGLPLEDLRSLREQTILAAVAGFAPDLFIVDYAPRGGLAELMPTLEAVSRETPCVLGLRDILGVPGFVERNWARAGNEACIREHFDAVWIYGDQRVYDAVREYNFAPDIAAITRYTGFICGESRDQVPGEGSDPYDLCFVGGGQDGEGLALAFAAASRVRPGVIVTGPYFPRAARQELECRRGADLRVVEFTSDPSSLLAGADRVIAMGGYNTSIEIVAMRKKGLIVPRLNSRREQILRAERFAALGLVGLLEPDRLSPEAIGRWLKAELADPPELDTVIDLSGASRVRAFASEIVSAPHRAVTAA